MNLTTPLGVCVALFTNAAVLAQTVLNEPIDSSSKMVGAIVTTFLTAFGSFVLLFGWVTRSSFQAMTSNVAAERLASIERTVAERAAAEARDAAHWVAQANQIEMLNERYAAEMKVVLSHCEKETSEMANKIGNGLIRVELGLQETIKGLQQVLGVARPRGKSSPIDPYGATPQLLLPPPPVPPTT